MRCCCLSWCGRCMSPQHACWSRCSKLLAEHTTSVPGAAALVCSRSMRCSSSSIRAGCLQLATGLPCQSAAAVPYATPLLLLAGFPRHSTTMISNGWFLECDLAL
jgi:hypothetical protein